MFYGICFLFRPMMPRRFYFIMAFGFIVVDGAQIAYLWAKTGDPLYRDIGNLTGRDREIAKDFLEMLAKKTKHK